MMLKCLFLACAASLFCACGNNTPTATPTTGPASTSTSPAIRIVSTVPAATLNLVLIGAADTIVGVSKYDQPFLPEDKQYLPVVGDYFDMNYETLIALHPTAVIIQDAEARIPARLREVAAKYHFDIVNIKLNTTKDIWGAVETLGHVSGHDGDAARALADVREQLKLLDLATKNRSKPKVVYILERSPMSIAGGGSFLGEMVELAGGENLGTKISGLYPTISNETLVTLAPEVLLISAPSQIPQHENDDRLDPFARLPIPAAWNNRIYLITDGNAMVASLQLPKQVQELAAIIQRGEPGGPAPSTAPSTTAGGKP